MPIHSVQVERHALGGLIRNTDVIADVEGFVTEFDFYNDVHSTLYCVILEAARKGEKLDKVLLAKKVKDLGISFKDEIDIFDYVESLAFTQITEKATITACKELVKMRIRREYYQMGEDIKNEAKGAGNMEIDDFITKIDGITNSKVNAYDLKDEPVNIFQDIDVMVEERGNNPLVETGLITPYPEFNRLYGGLKGGNIYAIVSRPGQGKSTWINDICFRTSLLSNFKVKALILDTEMETPDIKWRMVSSLTGVPMWYLETGNWRKNSDMVAKVRPALALMKNYQYFHYKVGNKTIDQICSIIKRWYFKNVGRGNQCIIAYDYIKLTGEKIGQNYAEHQAIGDKVDKLKKVSEFIGCPLITAMQMNRSGENRNRKGADVTDDASAISLSDRLQWFGTWVSIFRRKTLDEIEEDGEQFGTHKMINLKSRFQGRDATGHHDMLKRRMQDGTEQYVYNYLNYDVKNFAVQEVGSLRQVVEASEQRFQLNDKAKTKNDGEIM